MYSTLMSFDINKIVQQNKLKIYAETKKAKVDDLSNFSDEFKN